MTNFLIWVHQLPFPVEMSETTDEVFVLRWAKKLTVHYVPLQYEGDLRNNPQPNTIILWEDIWFSHMEFVKGTLLTLLGQHHTINATPEMVAELDQENADVFLLTNHLSGIGQADYRLGLLYKSILVAVATFRLNAKEVLDTAEIVQYASLSGLKVSNGLQVLIDHFRSVHPVRKIGASVPAEWACTEPFTALGFAKTAVTAPEIFWIHPDDMTRLSDRHMLKEAASHKESRQSIEEQLMSKGYLHIKTAGNLIFELDVS